MGSEASLSAAAPAAGGRCALIIPARYQSSRFPGKPLMGIAGPDGASRPLIEWTYRAARAAANGDPLFVATDDERIAQAVRDFGGAVLMTDPACRNGTERVADCLGQLDDVDILVNVQGDALLTPPPFIAALRDHMRTHPETPVATVAIRASGETYRHLAADAAESRVGGTTVVLDGAARALYFSKRILPYLPEDRMPDADMPVLLHLGLYAYRRAALDRYVRTGVTMLETVEGLEQLRFLVGGTPVSVLTFEETGYPIVEVNNPSDIPIVEGILSRRDMP